MSLRKGYTTGTCAQAAAKGAALMLKTGKIAPRVEVEIPSGKRLRLGLVDMKIGKGFASCAVIKDAGDDTDATHGTKIYAEARYSDKKGVVIKGGEGVGKVTKPGLAVGVGESAINPVPRRMIVKEVTRCLQEGKGIEVVISVPGGEEIAKKTANPQLGIIGGISIIGTTGIVEPKSAEAYKKSLSLQLNVLRASGCPRAVLVLGYVGEKYCKERLKIEADSFVKIGDHVGFMLKECARKGFREVLLAGHIGKIVKIANGQFNTNIKCGDERLETLARFAKRCGAKKVVIEEILNQTTAEAVIEILKKNGLENVFVKIAEKAVENIKKITEEKIGIRCVMLSLNSDLLAEAGK